MSIGRQGEPLPPTAFWIASIATAPVQGLVTSALAVVIVVSLAGNPAVGQRRPTEKREPVIVVESWYEGVHASTIPATVS